MFSRVLLCAIDSAFAVSCVTVVYRIYYTLHMKLTNLNAQSSAEL